jgi:excisionase family DNA binding protein
LVTFGKEEVSIREKVVPLQFLIDTFFMDIKNTTEELLTVKEAADLLKITEVTIKRYIAKELIPSVKIGGARRIIKGDMWDDFVQKMRSEKLEKLDEETDYFVAEPQAEYLVSRELAKEERKSKIGFNGLTPTEWALLSKNVIVEDDLLNPVGRHRF